MGGDELSGAPGTKQVSLEVQNCLFGPLLWLSHQVDCGRFARVYVHFLCIAFQAYSIDETPVTNARFRQFVKETKYRTPCAAVLKLIGMTLQSLSHESESMAFWMLGRYSLPCSMRGQMLKSMAGVLSWTAHWARWKHICNAMPVEGNKIRKVSAQVQC